MLTETERKKLLQHYRQELPDEWDKGDVASDIDGSLSFGENLRVLNERGEGK